MSREDARVVAEIIGGDKNAFRKLVAKYWNLIAVLVYQKIGDRCDAEDIAQDAFLRAYRSLPKLRHQDRFLAWLLRISNRLVADHVRRRRRERSVSLQSLEENATMLPAAHPADPAEIEEEHRRLLLAVGRLPDRYRLVVTMRYLRGYSLEAIARAVGEPPGTVRNRLFRAHRKLERILRT